MKLSYIRRTIMLSACVLLFSSGGGAWAQSTAGVPSAAMSAELAFSLQPAGVRNFGQVTETLYRGAQPTAEGFASLKKLGVQAVVNFRRDPDRIAAERLIVEQLGMRYISIPWRGKDDPSDAQVAEFLSFVRANPTTKVFVHCRRGAERTGLMVAAFRMATQGWTPSQAVEEMEKYDFRGFRFRHLKRYVQEFPGRFPQFPPSPEDPAPAVPTKPN